MAYHTFPLLKKEIMKMLMQKSVSRMVFAVLSIGLVSTAFATTPLPCVPNGYSSAPIFERPDINLKDVETSGGLFGAAWVDGTGDPVGTSEAQDPLLPSPTFDVETPVDTWLLDGVGPSAFVSLVNNDGVFSYYGHDGEWHEIDDYDVNPFVDGCIHLRVCWTVHAYKIYTPPAPTGSVGVGGRGVEAGVEFPIGTPEPFVQEVDLSFCEEKEVCPC